MQPLRRASLHHLPAHARPAIEPGSAGVGIVHIGLGSFHRAHQAVFTEAAMAAAGGDWAIAGVAPRSRDLLAVLRAQDHLYSVSADQNRVVAALSASHHLPSEPDGVLRRLTDNDVRVVTLTITEKGYRLDDEVRADLGGRAPRTALGLVVRGLRARAHAGAPPLAVVSCDNLPGNGARLRGLVEQANNGGFGDWVAFPSTMVDRIVPPATASTVERASAALGVRDLAALEAEPFAQWVIADDFPGGRPAWERAGAILTSDVTAWERLKLRVLNGSHSTIAYLGALAGCATIADSLALPGMAELVRHLISDDVAPTLQPPAGVSVTSYGEQVLTRLASRAVAHPTAQVAMDGSQKLPQRLIPVMLERRRRNAAPIFAALGVAGWMRFVQGRADDGRPLALQDPLAETIRDALRDSDDPAGVVAALLRLGAIFPAELADDREAAAEITGWLEALTRHGAADTVRNAIPRTAGQT